MQLFFHDKTIILKKVIKYGYTKHVFLGYTTFHFRLHMKGGVLTHMICHVLFSHEMSYYYMLKSLCVQDGNYAGGLQVSNNKEIKF
ncbi:hypothetical protein KSF78_0009392 [Schistosoma japonicum]|nr:hypothetical protein KSF78_0009392 [Schistosoma japonicum]